MEKKKTVWSRQKAVGRIQRSEVRRQYGVGRIQKSEVRGQKTVSRGKGKERRVEDRSQETVWSRQWAVGRRKGGVLNWVKYSTHWKDTKKRNPWEG